MRKIDPWWPKDLGEPNSAGGQNDLQYAYFGDRRRLAVKRGQSVTLYDTVDHRISGVSQQQGAGRGDSVFTSQHGQVPVDELRKVDG